MASATKKTEKRRELRDKRLLKNRNKDARKKATKAK